jgi:hypothetical protein
MFKNDYLARVYDEVSGRSAGETEFLQAVREVLESLEAYVEKHPELNSKAFWSVWWSRNASFSSVFPGWTTRARCM